MNGRLWAGFGASTVSVTAAASSWLDLAEHLLRVGSSLVALAAGIVSLYFLFKKRGR